MQLTEDDITRKLQAAIQKLDPSLDDYSELDVTDETRFKCAAVLIPLVWQDNEWYLLFTRRTNKVESHKGQVSFPGGGCDDGEKTPEETALREVEEEIGINRKDIRVLGRLGNMITITSFRVTPVVGVIPWPVVLRLGQHEVDRVFTIPLKWLADKGNRWEFPFPGRNRGLIAYHPYDGELLWGATARMTVTFVRIMEI